MVRVLHKGGIQWLSLNKDIIVWGDKDVFCVQIVAEERRLPYRDKNSLGECLVNSLPRESFKNIYCLLYYTPDCAGTWQEHAIFQK